MHGTHTQGTHTHTEHIHKEHTQGTHTHGTHNVSNLKEKIAHTLRQGIHTLCGKNYFVKSNEQIQTQTQRTQNSKQMNNNTNKKGNQCDGKDGLKHFFLLQLNNVRMKRTKINKKVKYKPQLKRKAEK